MSPALGTNPLRQTLFRRTAERPAGGEAGPAPPAAPPPPPSPEAPQRPAPEGFQAVAFSVGSARFGLDIRQVSCIVRMVEITRFPRAPRYVEGIINLRGEIVPVLSLQRLFGWPFQGDVLGMYIIVGDVAGRRIGLIADSVATMCEVAGEQLEAPSGADRLAALLSWVAKLDDGIMFVLDFERVAAVKDNPDFAVSMGSDQGPTAGLQEGLSLPVQAALRERARELRERATPEEIELKLFFTFALGAERYAIDVGNVAKVLPLPHITAVPGTPTHFAGMINHAGDILWVLDIKELLGLSATLPGNDERIVVVDYERIRFGFLVDAAHDVVSFPIKAVRPALAAEKVKDDYVSAEIYWRDDLLAVLDLAVLARAAGESAPA